MYQSICMSSFSASLRGFGRVASALALVLMAAPGLVWGGDEIRLSLGGGGRSADGLVVDYTMGAALPGVVTANVVSNLGSVPYTVTVQSSGWLTVSPLSGTTPAAIGITVNPSGLAVGTYSGSVTVNTTVQLNGKILDASDTSPVTLRIAPGAASAVTVGPASLVFDGTVGQALAAQAVLVSSTPGSVNFTVGSSSSWLSVNPASGITNGAAGQSVGVYVNTAGLAVGDYTGILTVSTPGATPATQTVVVSLKLRAAVNVLTMAPPATMSFTGVAGGQVPAGQSFGVEAGAKNLAFTAMTNAAWLSATPASGLTPGAVAVQVNPAGLAEGTYQGVVTTTVADASPAAYQTAVTLTLSKAAAPQALPLTATPVSLNFVGMLGGANPAAGLLTATDPAGTAGVMVAVAVDVPWLTVTPASGAAPLGVEVKALTAGLTVGQRTGHVTLTRTDVTPNLVTTVPVTLAVVDGAVLGLSPTSVSLKGRAGETGGGSQVSMTVTTTSVAPVSYEMTLTSTGGWLVAPGGALTGQVSAASPVSIAIAGDAKALASGSYDGLVRVQIAGQSGSALTAPVVFQVDPAAPALVVTPEQLTFSGLAGGVPAAAQTVQVTTNPGTLAWTAVAGAAWLKVTPASGNGTQALQVSTDPGQLAPGKYSATVTVNGGAGEQAMVQVTLEVQPASAPTFAVDPSSLEFTKMQGAAGAGQQTVVLTGLSAATVANGQIQWGATASTKSGGNWLTAELVNTGTLPVTVKVYADAAGLTAGAYEGTVMVTAAAATVRTVEVAVRLVVTAPVMTSYVLNPVAVSTDRVEGSTQSEMVDVAVVPAQEGLQYSAVVSGGGWLTISGTASGAMPGTVHLMMNPTGLTPGVYKGKLTVTATSSVGGVVVKVPEQVCDLVLTVTGPPPPSVKVSAAGSGGLVFDLDHPNDNPGTISLASLRNEGGGTVPVQVVSDQPWLTFASGVLQVGNDVAGVPLIGILNQAAVPGTAGSYVAGYTLTVAGTGLIHSGTVGLLVKSSAPGLELAPTGMTLTLGGGYSPSDATVAFSVKNTGAAAQAITVTPGSLLTAMQNGQLTLQPGASAVLSFSVNSGLVVGVYTSVVTLSAQTPGGSLERAFQVGLDVVAKPPLSVTSGGPKSVSLGAWGLFQIVLKNPTAAAASFYASSGPLAGVMALGSFNVDPPSGTVAAGSEMTVLVAGQTGLTPGAYGQMVSVYFDGQPFLVPIVVGATVEAGPVTACENGKLLPSFVNLQDGSVVKAGLATTIEILAVNSCGGLLTKGSVSALPSNGDEAIIFRPSASPGTWVGTWTALNAASPEVDLTLTAWDEVTKLRGTAKVRLTVRQVAALPVVTSVVNPSYGDTAGATAVGGWLTIRGKNLATARFDAAGLPYPEELGGTTVLLGGRALPLMMASPGEVSAFVPYDMQAGSVLPMQVVRGQVGSTPFSVAVNAQMPSLFLNDPQGESREGRVAASRGNVWFDASLTNPVMAGDILYIDAVGLGAVDQDVSPAKPAPSNPLARVKASATATVGGLSANIWYLGLIPGTVGVYQVRIEVPAGVAPGNGVPIVLTVGGQSSSPVTVALR